MALIMIPDLFLDEFRRAFKSRIVFVKEMVVALATIEGPWSCVAR